MSEDLESPTAVVRGNAGDAEIIVGWLKEEWDRDDGRFGFWGNREMIRQAAADDGDLWVVREGGDAVAFQVGDHSADIVAVRPDRRGRGLGTLLTDAALARAVRDDVTTLHGQCSPEDSLGFWQRMGFARYDDRRRPGDVLVRKVLHRSNQLPEGAPRVSVRIAFYPEEAQYHGAGDSVVPLAVHDVAGAVLDDGTVRLEQRVVGLEDDEPEGRNLAVRIEVDGELIYFGKAKYEEAAAAGVVTDHRSGADRVDAVRPAAAAA